MSERRIRAADDVDAIYSHIQRVKAERAKELQAADHDAVAQKMSESAKPYVDYCGFTMPDQALEQERLRKIEALWAEESRKSAEWQATWLRRNTQGANVA